MIHVQRHVISMTCSLALLLVAAVPSVHSQEQYRITTFAGNGAAEYSGDGGPAPLAGIQVPYWVSVCADGTLLISDTGNYRIRKVTTDGIISTIAGNGVLLGLSGNGDNGPAIDAQMTRAIGICEDGSGNVYFADSDAGKIRKIDASGIITTVVGNGLSGCSGDGGSAREATIDQPCGILIDGSGNMYIADFDNACIRRVDSNNIIATVAGRGQDEIITNGALATSIKLLTGTFGLALRTTGDLYFTVGSGVVVMNSSGKVRTVAGNPYAGRYHGDTTPSGDIFNTLTGICTDSMGNIFVADSNNNRIRKIRPSGIITTIAGTGKAGFSGDEGPAMAATLDHPMGICIDDDGNIYIADTGNNRIRKLVKSP